MALRPRPIVPTTSDSGEPSSTRFVHWRSRFTVACTDRKLRFRRRERRPPLPAGRPVHSPLTVSNLSRDRYARIPANALCTHYLRLADDVTTRGAAGNRACVSARHDYMEFSDYATYLRTASERECVRSTVIIIITRLIIVIGGDGAHCHRQITAARDQTPPRSNLAACSLPLWLLLLDKEK